MRLAVATWNGRVSPVFDVARQVQILDVEDGVVRTRHEEELPGTEPRAQVDRLTAMAPHVLICGAVSRSMEALLATTGIEVISFTAGEVEEVLAAWLAGSVSNPALSMPGCRGRGRCGGGRGNRIGWQGGRRAARSQGHS